MKRLITGILLLSMAIIVGCSAFKGSMLNPQLSKNEDTIATGLEIKYLTYDGHYEGTGTARLWTGSEVKHYDVDLEYAMKNNTLQNKKDDFKLRRNEILSNLIILMNIRYNQYERTFYQLRGTVSSAFDIAVLAATATGTVVGGESTKTLLSAIAAGLTGTRLTLEKNFVFEQTTPLLIATMRTSRENKLNGSTGIKENMKRPIVDEKEGTTVSAYGYSLAQGLVDVQEYFYAGTIIAAVQQLNPNIRNLIDNITAYEVDRKKLLDIMTGTSTATVP